MSRLVGYSEETIKYSEESIIVSYEKLDQIINDYKNEVEHVIFLCESKRELGWNIKESFDEISKYIESLNNVPKDVKNNTKKIYNYLEKLDINMKV